MILGSIYFALNISIKEQITKITITTLDEYIINCHKGNA